MDQEYLRKERFDRISAAYKSGDVYAYSNAVLAYINEVDKYCFESFYSRYLNVNASIDDADNYCYEFCFEREKRVYPHKEFSVIIHYDLFKYIEPIVISVHENFCDTGNVLMSKSQWVELSSRLKALSAQLKTAKDLAGMSDYVFSLCWVYNQILFMDIDRFLQHFPKYLDDVCSWIDEAVLDDDNIWIMGL